LVYLYQIKINIIQKQISKQIWKLQKYWIWEKK